MERRRSDTEKDTGTLTRLHQEVRPFFYPKNVAVIGVSPEPANLGRNIVRNLLRFEYAGEILSVGIKPGVVFGQRIYESIQAVDHDVDLAVILTPAKTVPAIMTDCGKKGIRRVVIESGGFSELGREGVAIEQECIRIAGEYGIRFIGPNGIGVTNMENGLATPFWPLREDLTPGPVSVLAQSGGVGLSYLGFLVEENIGLNKFVSMGNKLNVDESDLLAYLIEDPGTEIILLYLEGFTNGRRFIEIASRSSKPVLVHKSNRSQASARIAHSHTTALSANDKLVDDALSQAGCFRVNTMAEAMDHVKSFMLPPLRGNRLAVVSRSGGHAVIATDACSHYGFTLPPFPPTFLEDVERHLRAHVIRLQNPLDLGDLFDLEVYERIIRAILSRDDVDGVLLGHGYRRGFEQELSRRLIERVQDLVQKYEKPVATVIFAEAIELEYLKRHFDIPIFSAPENAMRAFHLAHTWAARRQRPFPPPDHPPAREKAARDLLHQATGNGFFHLSEALDFLTHCGFPVPRWTAAHSSEEAVQIWRDWGAPVAMKVNRPHVSHKTDTGLVALNLDDAKGIDREYHRFRAQLATDSLEVVLQPMIFEGLEVIVGGRQDPVFGPVVLFGLGGIDVEVLGDAVMRLAPIEQEDALDMMGRIRGTALLEGSRGRPPGDKQTLAGEIVRMSRLLADFPEIREIDVNPLRIGPTPESVQVLDARIVLESSGPSESIR